MRGKEIKLTECPRDAMQGLHDFIPTDKKIEYLNLLLKVGFDVLDFGSFVSPKAIPQLKDTSDVVKELDNPLGTQLLAIIANERGAEAAVQHHQVSIVGFPFSISEEFQQRNTKASREQALQRLKQINDIVIPHNVHLRVYLSMAFGNPYNEVYSPELVLEWSKILYEELGVSELVLSDTIGNSSQQTIQPLFSLLNKSLPNVEFSAHLHSDPTKWQEKVQASFEAGCTSFDGALKGIGGCPLAGNDLVGNLATENLVGYFKGQLSPNFKHDAYLNALNAAGRFFS